MIWYFRQTYANEITVAKQHKQPADALLDAAAELLDISAYPLDTVQRTYDITSVQSSYKHGLLNEEQSLYRSAEEGVKHLYHTCAIGCLNLIIHVLSCGTHAQTNGLLIDLWNYVEQRNNFRL